MGKGASEKTWEHAALNKVKSRKSKVKSKRII